MTQMSCDLKKVEKAILWMPKGLKDLGSWVMDE